MVIIYSIVYFLLYVSYNSIADTFAESSGAVETPCFYTDIMVIINNIFSSMYLITIAVTHQLTEKSGPLVSSYTDIMVIIVSFLLYVSYNSIADTYESSGAVETPCFYTDIMVIINDIFSSMYLVTLLLSLMNGQEGSGPLVSSYTDIMVIIYNVGLCIIITQFRHIYALCIYSHRGAFENFH